MSLESSTLVEAPFWEPPQNDEKPIDLLGFLGVFLSRWPLLLAFSLAGLLVTLAVSSLLTPRYTAQAVFMPPAEQRSESNNPLVLMLRPPSSSVYSGLLLSDSVLGDVVQELHLQELFRSKDLPDARGKLKSLVKVNTGTDEFITLRVTCTDPRLAQQIASSLLIALMRLQTRLAVDSATQARLQYQTQLDQEKNALGAAETALEKAQEQSGVVLPQSQTLSGLSAIDVTRSSIRANQVALASLLQSRTEQAPEVVRLRSEIAAQQGQLARLESSAASSPGSGLTAGQAPAVNLKFVQLEREVKYHQVLFDVMVREFQTAKIQETSNAPGVQIVDYPELPLHKSWPPRTLFSLAGGVLGLLCGLIVVFVADRARVLRANQLRAQSISAFSSAWKNPTFRP